jgi:CTD small phosphatase-like protein 2
MKDIRIIEGVDLSRTVLVDNSASSFGVQLNNGIPIIPYFFKEDDIELIKLRNYLVALEALLNLGCDARVILKKYFKLE